MTGLSPTNVLFDPTTTRLEEVPEEAVSQAIEECKRLARKVALLEHPECDDAIVEITGMECRPGLSHVDANVRLVPPPKVVHIVVKVAGPQDEGLKLSSADERRYREEYIGELT